MNFKIPHAAVAYSKAIACRWYYFFILDLSKFLFGNTRRIQYKSFNSGFCCFYFLKFTKINIVIGQISFLIWICIAIGHIAYLILTCCQDIRCFSWTILVIAFVATIGLIIRLLYNPYKQNKTNNKADKVDKTDKANKPDRADKTVQNKDTVKSCQAPLNIVSKHLATTNDNIQDKEKAEKPESE